MKKKNFWASKRKTLQDDLITPFFDPIIHFATLTMDLATLQGPSLVFGVQHGAKWPCCVYPISCQSQPGQGFLTPLYPASKSCSYSDKSSVFSLHPCWYLVPGIGFLFLSGVNQGHPPAPYYWPWKLQYVMPREFQLEIAAALQGLHVWPISHKIFPRVFPRD